MKSVSDLSDSASIERRILETHTRDIKVWPTSQEFHLMSRNGISGYGHG